MAWLAVWLAEVFVAVAIAAPAAATKARRANSSLFSGPGRKFVMSFAPPIFVGGLTDICAVSIGSHLNIARAVVVAVRHGDRDWRRVFGASGADHGSVRDGAGCWSIVCASAVGKYLYGGGIWRGTNRIWIVDCVAVRRLREYVKKVYL